MVEEQAKELGVGAAGGAKNGGQKGDTMIVSAGMLILFDFLLGGFAQRLVDVCRVSKLAFDCWPVLDGSSWGAPQRSWVMERFFDCWWALFGNRADSVC